MTSAFVDTNILVYAIQGDDPRSPVAAQLVRDLMDGKLLRTSTQVLQELFVTITRTGRSRLEPDAALRYVDQIAEAPVVTPDYTDVRRAIMLTMTASISYWDALIVVAADRSGAKILYSEDLQHNQKMLGVRIVNPFRDYVTH